MVAELQTRLRSINAGVDGYKYTADDVLRVVFFPDQLALDSSLKTVYLIRPGREPRVITQLRCFVEARLELFVLVATRFTEPTQNPYLSDPVRWQNATDMVGDVLQKIHEDTTLGGTCIDVIEVDTDLERYLPNWTLAEIRLVIRYRYVRAGGR